MPLTQVGVILTLNHPLDHLSLCHRLSEIYSLHIVSDRHPLVEVVQEVAQELQQDQFHIGHIDSVCCLAQLR